MCHHPILSQYFLVLECRPYHTHCLRCALCHCILSFETTCYVRDGLVMCQRDYKSKFRRSCAKCRLTLESDDVVMRARDAVFHVHCFSCIVCGIPLNVGDIFTMSEHWEIFCQNYAEDEQPTHSRSKRMRTSFKHHQLRTMKQYFNLNHNPDAKDLKQLAQKTGLTKRVLQVWFQNARAKFRRSMHSNDGASISPLAIMSSGVHDCQVNLKYRKNLDLSQTQMVFLNAIHWRSKIQYMRYVMVYYITKETWSIFKKRT
ncbi:homeobox domain protein [Dictyocaulus viviparus]|uniref:Homeobox domain protein n=1 Tax=Dictyocaulus viviparus TaxID=29172 RepID=A0A0D8XIE3_DICVI|nr:homeobox domain protein [Dictyocaulus viviparus]